MKEAKNVWLSIVIVVSILFSIVALVKILIDRNYINGIQYLLTAIIFFVAFVQIKRKSIKLDLKNPMLNLGFIFSIVGLVSPVWPGLQMGLWIFGIVFFVSGLINK